MVKNKWKVILFVIIFIGSCSNYNNKAQNSEIINDELPEYIRNLDSLVVYPTDNPAPNTVELVRETVFESNEDVFFDGYSREVVIDHNNNVFVAVTKPGTVAIYVFNSDGSFITKFLREGRGPGEFESIGSLIIHKKKLYVFGPRLKKIGLFSIKDYSLIDDYKIKRSFLKEDTSGVYRVTDLIKVYDDGTMLTEVKDFNIYDPIKKRMVLYYKLSAKAVVQPGIMLEQEAANLYKPATPRTSEGYIRTYRSMPYTPSPLLAVHKNYIYAAQSGSFFIKTYDKNGAYQRSFYYPYVKSVLSISDLDLHDSQMQLINENSDQVPDTWPALHTMEMDDKGRFWVLTISDSENTYQGWVLNEKGALLAKFEWPGQRNQRNAGIQPLFKVKNGYLYTREGDLNKGIDRIVKYKINFKKR
jgi:hypothetical protein